MSTKLTGVAASEVVPANASRKALSILNEDGTDSVYIKKEAGEALTVSATDHDWLLPPGGGMSVNSMLDGLQAIQSRYTAIASANTPRIAIFESEDIRR